VNPRSMGRWLTRTGFASLVAHGWIGTANLTDEMLHKYVENALAAGTSIVLAVGSAAHSLDGDSLEDATEEQDAWASSVARNPRKNKKSKSATRSS
jgi:hypothetical protein